MRNQRGFSLVEVLLIVLVVAVIGFGGWYVWGQQKDNSSIENTDTPVASQKQETESTSTLDGITKSYANLNPDTLNDQDELVAVDFFSRDIEDDLQLARLSLESNIYANFKGDATPLQEQMIKALTDNGLTLNGEVYTSSLISHEAEYTNEDVLCNLYISQTFGRLNCVLTDRYNFALRNVDDIDSVLSAEKNTEAQGLSIKFYEGGNNIYGALVDYKDSDGNYFPSIYLANTGNDWEVIAETSIGQQDQLPAPCEDLYRADLEDLFANQQCL